MGVEPVIGTSYAVGRSGAAPGHELLEDEEQHDDDGDDEQPLHGGFLPLGCR
jgi:hypothetical protein